ncbi:uncharacterized mitochondrial protein AtMg00310-like [Lotus japonicus]|uniref:uncharacterized mitochondrial protein AtMg00310-like n=1 Tax=Lotus japonicus TaxID=34305 RepID=UPI00258B7D91|nr:uncharacterized mitochondrial protein AtMg00310-like [Lotus japonicus]
MDEALSVMNTIRTYERASGQLVNLDKSEVMFSQNVPDNQKVMIRERMCVKAVATHDKYLGLPTIIGKSKKQVFERVQERMWKKLKGWKEQTLSRAGKEVLLKSVAQAIPTYIMSCFRLPVGVCQKMETMCAKFWWGQRENERKIHWNSWRNLCKPKSQGGLGFRNIEDFNTALLGKQYWRILSNPESLLARMWKARYFPRTSILEASLGHNPSYSWRSVWGVHKEMKEGLKWIVGDGREIKIWGDA